MPRGRVQKDSQTEEASAYSLHQYIMLIDGGVLEGFIEAMTNDIREKWFEGMIDATSK